MPLECKDLAHAKTFHRGDPRTYLPNVELKAKSYGKQILLVAYTV